MYSKLKKEVCTANLQLPKRNLVTFTWGNVSAIDRQKGIIVIKPSGIEYDEMQYEQMVVLDLEGEVIQGTLNPSSDAPTHVWLYKAFSDIGGIVHTHSTHATAWAQACCDIPAYGTTHADYFHGAVPCTRTMLPEEIQEAYELNTGKLIEQTFSNRGIDPNAVPGVVVASHGPFTWGKNANEAVHNAVVLEEICKMAILTRTIRSSVQPMQPVLCDKHYLRKHGKHAYYGQGVPVK